MNAVLELRKVNFGYRKKIFEDFSIALNGDVISIIGTPGSGKSTLARIFAGEVNPKGVYFYGTEIASKDIIFLNRHVGVVNFNSEFLTETINDELSFALEGLCFSSKTIEEKIKKLLKYFDENLKPDKPLCNLTTREKALIKILVYLVIEVNILIIEDLLIYLGQNYKNKLLKYIKDRRIQLINITSNIEETLLGDYLYVLDQGKIAIEGKTQSVLQEEKILKRLGLQLPTVFDISLQLKSYKLIEKEYTDVEKLVGDLWK